MPIPAALSLVTLGVADVPRAQAFYTDLGFPLAFAVEGYAVLRTAGSYLALFPAGELAADAGLPPGELPAFRGTSLAVNVPEQADVDAALEAAVAAGGQLIRAAAAAPWGGYAGYFADPDGHAWEVAWNPDWPLDERGMPRVG